MYPVPPYPMNKRKSFGNDENEVKKWRNEQENLWMNNGNYWNHNLAMATSQWTHGAPNLQNAFWNQPSSSSSRYTPPLDLQNLQNLQDFTTQTPVSFAPNPAFTTTQTPVNFAPNPAFTSSTLLTPESDADESGDSSGGEWLVEGRLPVVNRKTKYFLDVEQVRRRCEAPECMNLTTLIKFFKKCKSKQTISRIKSYLSENGIHVPVMQRQKVFCSFTMLLEQECVMLAEDMGYLLRTYYPKETLGRKTLENLLLQGKSPEQCMHSLSNAVLCLNQIISTLSSRQPAISGTTERIKRHPLDAWEDRNCQQLNEKYETFSRLTHGYGHVDSLNYYTKYKEVFEEAMMCCQAICLGQYVELTKGRGEKKEWKYMMKTSRITRF